MVFYALRKKLNKNIEKNIGKNGNAKYSQKRLNYAKQSAIDAPKKKAEATGDLIHNKIANKITKN